MIGILGGTFDPIHLGHLRSALEVMEGLGLSEVLFVPSHTPPHRGTPEVAADRRVEMVRAAVASQPGFRVDVRELTREGPSYTVDTLESLRREFGADQRLCLMMGMDAFLGLPTWHRWESILGLVHLVVMHRPGYETGEFGALDGLMTRCRARDLSSLYGQSAGRIFLQAVTQLDISATAVRGLIAEGRSPRYLVPEAVCRLIEYYRLYA